MKIRGMSDNGQVNVKSQSYLDIGGHETYVYFAIYIVSVVFQSECKFGPHEATAMQWSHRLHHNPIQVSYPHCQLSTIPRVVWSLFISFPF